MKLLRISIFVAFFFASQIAISQICDGFITFNSQEALDQFAIDNPDCTEISGDLYLQFGVDTDGTPITNTDALQNIAIIGGRLTLEDNPMTSGYPVSLSGLSGMTYYYDLYIYSYANLTNLDGLDNITTIEGDLFIGMYGEDLSLAPLNNITSVFNVTFAGGPTASFENVLPGLTEIFGAVNIGYESPEFESFSGLENLLFCDALQVGYTAENSVNLQVFDACHNLQTCNYLILFCSAQTLFSGFENLYSCTNLEVWNTDAANPIIFNSLYGVEMLLIIGDFTNGITFPALQVVDQLYVEASGPIALTEVPFMSSIYVQYCGINAPLELQLNDTLSTVQLYVQYNAFEDLSFFPEGGTILSYLTLAYNENLSYCGHPAVCSFVALNPETSYIELNASGCNDSMEALASCGETLVSGKVYYDADCNGTFGGNDIPMSYQFILDDNGNIISATNLNGDYFIPASGNSIITIALDTIIGLLLPTPISIDLGAVQGNLANQDFPLCQDLNAYNVSVHLFPQDQLRPGFNADLAVVVNNQTWSAVSGTVTVDLSQMTGTTIVEAFAGTINGMQITFPIETLDPFSDQIFFYTVNTNANVPLGTQQTIAASIELDGGTDNYALDDSASQTLEVIGSYDPNDIAVNRPEIDYNSYDAANGEWLEYLIRFQNTGTAEAIFIHVLDTIPEELDLSSIEILQTSHQMEMSVEDREIDFFFNDIYLPDSTSNPEGSQGFIFYRIRTVSNLTLEDIIPNQGAIYFDFNAPIYTNIATTSFYQDCPADPVIGGLTALCGPGTFDLEALGDYTDYAWVIEGETTVNDVSFSFTSTEASEVSGMLIATDGLCGTSVSFTLVTYDAVLTPEIVPNGNTLVASGTGTFAWYFNGELLTDTDNTIEATESGIYTVQVIANGCSSDFAEIKHTYIGVESLSLALWQIYPNPASDVVRIDRDESFTRPYIEIYNTMGALVYSTTNNASYTMIECNQWASGLYTVRHGDLTSGQYHTEILVVR